MLSLACTSMLQQLSATMKYVLVIIVTLAVGLTAYSSPPQTTAVTTGYGRTIGQSQTTLSRFKVFCIYEGNEEGLATSQQLPTVQQGSFENVAFEKLQHPQFIKLAEIRKPGSQTNKQSESQRNSQQNRQKPQYESSFSWSSSQTQQLDKPTTGFLHNFGKNQQDNDNGIFPNTFSNTKWTQQKKPAFGTFSDSKQNQQKIINRPETKYDDSYIFDYHVNKQQQIKNSDKLLGDFDNNSPNIGNPHSQYADYNPLSTSTPDYGVNSEFDYNTMRYLKDHPDFPADKGVKPASTYFNNGNFDKSDNDFTDGSKQSDNIDYKPNAKYDAISTDNPFVVAGRYRSDKDKIRNNYQQSKYITNHAPISNDEKPQPDDYNNFSKGDKPSTIDHSSTGGDSTGSNEDHYYTEPTTQNENSHDQAQQHDYYSPSNNAAPNLHKEINEPANGNPQDQLTDGDLQSQVTNGKPQSENAENQPTIGNSQSLLSNGNLQSQPTGFNSQNQTTNGSQQSEPRELASQNQSANVNLQSERGGLNLQNQSLNGNPQSHQDSGFNPQNQTTGFNPQNQTTGFNPQNQTTNGNPQSQPTNGNPQSQAINGNQQNQTAKENTQNQPNGKTAKKLTPLQIIGNVVNNYIVKPVSKLFSG